MIKNPFNADCLSEKAKLRVEQGGVGIWFEIERDQKIQVAVIGPKSGIKLAFHLVWFCIKQAAQNAIRFYRTFVCARKMKKYLKLHYGKFKA